MIGFVIKICYYIINEIKRKISDIVNVVVATGSAALTDKLNEFEENKAQLEQALSDTYTVKEEVERKNVDIRINTCYNEDAISWECC